MIDLKKYISGLRKRTGTMIRKGVACIPGEKEGLSFAPFAHRNRHASWIVLFAIFSFQPRTPRTAPENRIRCDPRGVSGGSLP